MTNIAGRFYKAEETAEYKLIALIGSLSTNDIGEKEERHIKGFYGMPQDSKFELIPNDKAHTNGYIKIYKPINRMCQNCLCLNNSCQGTTETVWTGCIYKKTATKETAEHMTKEEVSNLIDKLNGR